MVNNSALIGTAAGSGSGLVCMERTVLPSCRTQYSFIIAHHLCGMLCTSSIGILSIVP